jgi:hypothetical protein
MRILDLSLRGAHGETNLALQPGLNVIHEPDATALTILWNSLLAMLYGPGAVAPHLSPSAERRGQPAQPRSGRKRRSKREKRGLPSVENNHLEGTLLLALDNGQEYRLRRLATPTTHTFQIFDARTGNELTEEFQNGPNFVESHLGLSRELFSAAACMSAEALRIFAEGEEETVSAALSQILDSGLTQTSSHTAIQRIDRKLAEIGTVYSADTLMAEAYKRRDTLHQKRLAAQSAQHANSDDQEEADELAAEIKILETRLAILEHEALADEITGARARLARYDDCRRQIEKMAAEQATLAELKDFPISGKEKFFQLHHELSHLDKLQELLAAERNALELKLMAMAERTDATGVDESTWERHSFEEFYALHTQWQTTLEQIVSLETAKHEADAGLEAAGLDAAERLALAGLGLKRLEELKQRDAEIKAQEKQVEQRRAAYDDFQNRAQSHRRFGALIALAALAALTGGLFHLNGQISNAKFWGGMLPLMLSIGGLLLFLFLNYRWLLKSRQLAADLFSAEKTYMSNQQDLRDILGGFKVQNVDELFRQRMLFVEIGAASQEYAKRTEEMGRIERLLAPWMLPLGLTHIAIETLVAAEQRLRESYQLWLEKRNARENIQRLAAQLADVQNNRKQVGAAIEGMLAEAKIALPLGEQSFQAYVQACQKREYLETLQAQSSQVSALAEEILRGQSREQLAADLNRLELSLQTAATPRLPGHLEEALSPALIHERIAALESAIVAKQQALAVNRERVRLREHASASLSEIDEALVLAEDEINRLHGAQQALQTARNILLTARQHVHNDFARRANALLNRRLERLTGGRRTTVKLDPADFSLHVLTKPGPSASTEKEESGQTLHRHLFLFLRLSMPALMSESHESIPLLIEASSLTDDMKQHTAMYRVVESIAEKQQVLFITHDKKTVTTLRQRAGMGRRMEIA